MNTLVSTWALFFDHVQCKSYLNVGALGDGLGHGLGGLHAKRVAAQADLAHILERAESGNVLGDRLGGVELSGGHQHQHGAPWEWVGVKGDSRRFSIKTQKKVHFALLWAQKGRPATQYDSQMCVP